MIAITIEGRVPLAALQDAVIHCRLASQASISIQRAFQVVRKHLPFAGTLVQVEQIILGAAILSEEHGQYCQSVDCLQGPFCFTENSSRAYKPFRNACLTFYLQIQRSLSQISHCVTAVFNSTLKLAEYPPELDY